jgi:hypothetical protein
MLKLACLDRLLSRKCWLTRLRNSLKKSGWSWALNLTPSMVIILCLAAVWDLAKGGKVALFNGINLDM